MTKAGAWGGQHCYRRDPRQNPKAGGGMKRDEEVSDLEHAQRARDIRRAVLDADPTVACRIHQLEDLLGDVPDDAARRDEWRAAARVVIGYRERWQVDCLLRADLTTAHGDLVRDSARDALVDAVQAYTGQALTRDERVRRPEIHRDVADDEGLAAEG